MLKQLFNFITGGGNPNSLSGAEFKAKYLESTNAVLLDVRAPSEFVGGHLKGAKNINVLSPNFQTEIKKLDKEKTYFVYCRSGARSSQACSTMEQLGYSAFNLSGGIGAWPK